MRIVVRMVNKFPAIRESETSLSQSRMLDNGSHPEAVSQPAPLISCLILFSNLRLVFESGLFLLGFQTPIMCAFPTFHLSAICKQFVSPLIGHLIVNSSVKHTCHEVLHYVMMSIHL
jgi:hypothetical protein